MDPPTWPQTCDARRYTFRLCWIRKRQQCTRQACYWRSGFGVGVSLRQHSVRAWCALFLPPSRHQSALTSEPGAAECCCGQRRPRRPGCCTETHRSLHTRGALRTFTTARKGKEKQEQNGSSEAAAHLPAEELPRQLHTIRTGDSLVNLYLC